MLQKILQICSSKMMFHVSVKFLGLPPALVVRLEKYKGGTPNPQILDHLLLENWPKKHYEFSGRLRRPERRNIGGPEEFH